MAWPIRNGQVLTPARRRMLERYERRHWAVTAVYWKNWSELERCRYVDWFNDAWKPVKKPRAEGAGQDARDHCCLQVPTPVMVYGSPAVDAG